MGGRSFTERFTVEGLSELEKSLAILPEHWHEAEAIWIRLAIKSIMVTAKDLAKSYIPQEGTYKLAAQDLHSGVNSVTYGGKPYDFGVEFGSYTYHQFLAWRGNGDQAGYFFWPAVRQFRDMEMVNLYFASVWESVKAAFPGYE